MKYLDPRILFFFSVLQLIPQISSLTPITTLLPLVGVLSLTALKDGYDEVVSAPKSKSSKQTFCWTKVKRRGNKIDWEFSIVVCITKRLIL